MSHPRCAVAHHGSYVAGSVHLDPYLALALVSFPFGSDPLPLAGGLVEVLDVGAPVVATAEVVQRAKRPLALRIPQDALVDHAVQLVTLGDRARLARVAFVDVALVQQAEPDAPGHPQGIGVAVRCRHRPLDPDGRLTLATQLVVPVPGDPPGVRVVQGVFDPCVTGQDLAHDLPLSGRTFVRRWRESPAEQPATPPSRSRLRRTASRRRRTRARCA